MAARLPPYQARSSRSLQYLLYDVRGTLGTHRGRSGGHRLRRALQLGYKQASGSAATATSVATK